MNPPEVFLLLGDPALRPRTLATIASELAALAEELTRQVEPWGPALTVMEAAALAHRASRLASAAFDAAHWKKLAELEALCAHCGHERGDHLTEAPHVCEAEVLGGHLDAVFDCGCPGYMAPGLYAAPTAESARTEPPPPAPETSPCLAVSDDEP
jgi:hypothetical protein